MTDSANSRDLTGFWIAKIIVHVYLYAYGSCDCRSNPDEWGSGRNGQMHQLEQG